MTDTESSDGTEPRAVPSAARPFESGHVPRTYLFALTDAGGTVPPEVGVVRRLVDRGHRVTVLADASMADEVQATGAAVVPWSVTPAAEFRDWELRTPTALARGMSDRMLSGPAPGHAVDTRAMLDRDPPDVVVTSAMSLGAMIAAEARGIRFDVLMPNVYPLPAPGRPPFGAGLKPARGPGGRLRDRAIGDLGTRLIDRYALEPINALRAQYGLHPIANTWDQQLRAHRLLVLTSQHFDFAGTLPEHVRYVGPILDDPTWAADEHWMPPAGDDPLVLVAMSSTPQNHVDCLQRITDALGTLPVRGLLTTGPAVPPDAIRAPANVTVVATAPHAAVLRHASVVVTHGGHGTVVKTLAAGLPLVILHHGRDQADNAARVTARGAGLSVPRRSSSRRIARAIAVVLSTASYRERAARLGEQVMADASSSTLLDELESVEPTQER
jgi:UDP:flavonoid glycosyltransferase YjiC (YdhE family)